MILLLRFYHFALYERCNNVVIVQWNKAKKEEKLSLSYVLA
ncbi:hypothetical protein [Desulfitobacterium hafniense]|nr:hypothetical protein [Desulfitobacterium hafniense]MEA5021839.1 hypothetical protein [Desulfitobacterium hafniense]